MNTSESAAVRNGLSAVVLAGGRSSRFGTDKASALLLGRPLLEWVVAALAPVCARTFVVKAKGQRLPAIHGFAFAEVEDYYDDRGPLAAIVSGFERCDAAAAFVVACDTPALVPAVVPFLFERLRDNDCVLPIVGGKSQPLCAIYDISACVDGFRLAVDQGRFGLVAALDDRRCVTVSEGEIRAVDPGLHSFLNANTPEMLAEVAALLVGEEGRTR